MQEKILQVIKEVKNVVVGQDNMIKKTVVGLISRGHILLEGVPGLAKTLTLKTLSSATDLSFKRIQFTPDLLPADLIGTRIYNPKEQDFNVSKGPIFANFILADEVNRAPAKVQSALLEAMEEKQVTIGKETFSLPQPFFVMATQNPIETEGTYRLPEAQVDRFMLKVIVNYPTKEEEKLIVDNMIKRMTYEVKKVITSQEILQIQKEVDEIFVDDKIKRYILDIVFATRYPDKYGLKKYKDMIEFGASPRASLYLTHSSRALAYLNGRKMVLPEDVKAMAFEVLRHRIILTYQAEAKELTSDRIIEDILSKVKIP